MTVAVGVREVRAKLSEMLEKAQRGETVVITRRGQEVARLVPPERKPPRKGGWMKGKIRYVDPNWMETPEDIIDLMEGKDDDFW